MSDALRLRSPRERVSRRAVWQWRIGAAMGHVVLTVVVVVADLLIDRVSVPWWAWVAYAALAITHITVMPIVRYRTHRWEVTETAAYTQSGWLSLERRIAPLSRVQTVDLDQGPIVRLLGLASVTITTASAAGALTVEGLDVAVAQQLVDDLTRRVEVEVDDAT